MSTDTDLIDRYDPPDVFFNEQLKYNCQQKLGFRPSTPELYDIISCVEMINSMSDTTLKTTCYYLLNNTRKEFCHFSDKQSLINIFLLPALPFEWDADDEFSVDVDLTNFIVKNLHSNF